jgi:DNA-binding beta-propeller fold protein YncE
MKNSGLVRGLFVISLFVSTQLSAQQSPLVKQWETDSTLRQPESVVFDANSKILYVSNIGDFDKAGDGAISKIGLDGKIISLEWVKGLSAPKGLGLYNNLLYAAEQNTVAVIDITTAAIIRRIPVEGAQMLNDIAVDSKGVIYVSDSKTNKVHRIENEKPSVYLENMMGANGLYVSGNSLYILTGSTLQKADADKKLITVAEGIEGGGDGIEMINDHELIVTGWAGMIYEVKDDGSKLVLSDTRKNGINAADLGIDKSTKTIYVPAMKKNKVIAYKLK